MAVSDNTPNASPRRRRPRRPVPGAIPGDFTGSRHILARSGETPLRAFSVLYDVPEGHALFRMSDDRHAPHVREGELVVVDLTDREHCQGELYLIRWSAGSDHESYGIMQVTLAIVPNQGPGGPFPGIYFRPLDNVRSREDIDERLRTGRLWMGDGPLKPEYLAQYLMGRVVGIYEGREDNLMMVPAASHTRNVAPARPGASS